MYRNGAGKPGRGVNVIPQDPIQQRPDFEIRQVGARTEKAIDIWIERQAGVRRWPVGDLTQEEMRADDNIRRASDCNETVVGFELALMVVIDPVTIANDLPSSCYAHEERRARLVELLLGRIERDTGGYVLKDVAHVWTVDCGCEEGSEGKTGVAERDVVESWLQHVPESVEEADEVGRVTVAAIDNGVAAAARDVVAS